MDCAGRRQDRDNNRNIISEPWKILLSDKNIFVQEKKLQETFPSPGRIQLFNQMLVHSFFPVLSLPGVVFTLFLGGLFWAEQHCFAFVAGVESSCKYHFRETGTTVARSAE